MNAYKLISAATVTTQLQRKSKSKKDYSCILLETEDGHISSYYTFDTSLNFKPKMWYWVIVERRSSYPKIVHHQLISPVVSTDQRKPEQVKKDVNKNHQRTISDAQPSSSISQFFRRDAEQKQSFAEPSTMLKRKFKSSTITEVGEHAFGSSEPKRKHKTKLPQVEDNIEDNTNNLEWILNQCSYDQ